jgi:hypothetical protein
LIYGVDADEVNPEIPQAVEEPVELGLVDRWDSRIRTGG